MSPASREIENQFLHEALKQESAEQMPALPEGETRYETLKRVSKDLEILKPFQKGPDELKQYEALKNEKVTHSLSQIEEVLGKLSPESHDFIIRKNVQEPVAHMKALNALHERLGQIYDALHKSIEQPKAA